MPFARVFDVALTLYATLYGNKLGEVSSKIEKSNVINSLLFKSQRDGIRLKPLDYMHTLNSSRSFILLNADHHFIASIIILSKWHDVVGQPRDLSDDEYLNTMFFDLLQRYDRQRSHVTNKVSYFESIRIALGKELQLQQKKPKAAKAIKRSSLITSLWPYERPDEDWYYLKDSEGNEGVFDKSDLHWLIGADFVTVSDEKGICCKTGFHLNEEDEWEIGMPLTWVLLLRQDAGLDEDDAEYVWRNYILKYGIDKELFRTNLTAAELVLNSRYYLHEWEEQGISPTESCNRDYWAKAVKSGVFHTWFCAAFPEVIIYNEYAPDDLFNRLMKGTNLRSMVGSFGVMKLSAYASFVNPYWDDKDLPAFECA
jgi:hypothetical protein